MDRMTEGYIDAFEGVRRGTHYATVDHDTDLEDSTTATAGIGRRSLNSAV